MIRCDVRFCSSSSKDCTLFHISRSGDESWEWIRLSGERKLLQLSPHEIQTDVHFCELHFLSTDFVPTPKGIADKSLKFGAVPSQFPPNHLPIPKKALFHWLKQYPDADLKLPIGFFNDLVKGVEAEGPSRMCTAPLHLNMEDLVEVKQEPVSPVQEETSPTSSNHAPPPNVPLMQMLLNAHLAQRTSDSAPKLGSEKILVPVAQPGGDPKRVFLLQVEKLQKNLPESAAHVEDLPLSQRIIKRRKEELSKEELSKQGPNPLPERHPNNVVHLQKRIRTIKCMKIISKVTETNSLSKKNPCEQKKVLPKPNSLRLLNRVNTVPVIMPNGKLTTVQVEKRNLNGAMASKCETGATHKTVVHQNGLDPGRKIILLRVEKLPKQSSNISTNENQLKEKVNCDEKSFSPGQENGILMRTIEPQALSTSSNPVLDVRPSGRSAESVSSVKSPEVEDLSFKETVRSNEEFLTPSPHSTFKEDQKTVHKKEIRRLQNRVKSLENLLLRLLDVKYIPKEVKKDVRNILIRGSGYKSKLKRRK